MTGASLTDLNVNVTHQSLAQNVKELIRIDADSRDRSGPDLTVGVTTYHSAHYLIRLVNCSVTASLL